MQPGLNTITGSRKNLLKIMTVLAIRYMAVLPLEKSLVFLHATTGFPQVKQATSTARGTWPKMALPCCLALNMPPSARSGFHLITRTGIRLRQMWITAVQFFLTSNSGYNKEDETDNHNHIIYAVGDADKQLS